MFTDIQTRRPMLLAAAFVTLGLMAATVTADTIYVPDDYPTIQEALFAAHDADTIVVRDGVYTGMFNKDIDFGGLAVTVRSENGPENCVIDCESDGRGFYFRLGEGPDSVVDGFTITNGSEGAIYVSYGNPTITNCILSYNAGGAALFWAPGPAVAVITNCVITNNVETGEGGGVACYGSATIHNCLISDNGAGGDYNAHGGGGIYCVGSGITVVITETTIVGNNAEWGTQYGHGGGGIYCRGSYNTLLVTNCTIIGNDASGWGGGIRCLGATDLTIANCTIAGNLAMQGGGVYCDSALIRDCTFTANTAVVSGGAVYCSNSIITDCILWGDTAPNGPELCVSGATTTIAFSDVEGGWAWVHIDGGTFNWGEGNIVADPLFVDPDGPDDDPNTWEDNDYHLGTDSPCTDTGDPDFVPELDERDIDGQMRVWDGDDDGVWIVDMGSDEFGSIIPADLNADGCVDHADLGILLSDWGCTGGDCPGDCDFDGDTDHSDLGILLGHWGEGCP